jgi:hypothetical protein
MDMAQYIKKGYRRKIDSTEAARLYEERYSFAEIAVIFGTSRQAVHLCLVRAGVHVVSGQRRAPKRMMADAAFADLLARMDRIREEYDRLESKYGQRHIARMATTRAIKKGQLVPAPCEVCGEQPGATEHLRRIEAHHDDYTKSLAIRWLCQRHHREWHKHNKAIG